MRPYSPDLLARAAQIKLLATDIDGVLTHGEIIYTAGGDELKIFNAKDGLGLWLARQQGILTAMITGRTSSINERRAEELGVHYLFQGIKDKLPVLQQILEENQWTLEQVAYMGDDLPDLPVLQAVGLAACPADAISPVLAASHLVSQHEGGHGAMRELTDLLLAARKN